MTTFMQLKHRRLIASTGIVAIACALCACGGATDDPTTPTAVAPVVSQTDYSKAAGPDFSVQSGSTAPLNCSGPKDSSYQWVIESNGGIAIDLSSYNSARSSFVAPMVKAPTTTSFICRMTVTNTIPATATTQASTAATTVTSRIAVTIEPPTVDSSATLMTTIVGNKTAAPGQRLPLLANTNWFDYKASPTIGPVINYSWTLGASAPAGTVLTPANGSAMVEVLIPSGLTAPVFFPVTVIATSGGKSSQSSITVLADPSASMAFTMTPQAQSVVSGAVVTFNATSGPNLFYQWTQVSGPTIALGGGGTNTVGFVAPVVTTPTSIVVRAAIGYSPITTTNPGIYFLDGVVTVTPSTGSTTTPTTTGVVSVTPVSQVVKAGAVGTATASTTSQTQTYYRWTQLSGPTVTLGGASTSTLGIVAPNVTAQTDLSFRVETSSTPFTASTPAQSAPNVIDIVMTVTPSATTSGAVITVNPASQVVKGGTAATVTASTTSTATMYYRWTQVSGTSVTLGGASTPTLGFVTPVVAANETLTFRVETSSTPFTALTPAQVAPNIADVVVTVTP